MANGVPDLSSLSGRRLFCSWSGGKDCCLALHRAVRDGGVPGCLITMLREDGAMSRSHGLSTEVIRAQAASLGTELITRATSWEDYRQEFLKAVSEAKHSGAEIGVFGDIDLEEHRDWVNDVCGEAGVEPVLPLWRRERKDLLGELLAVGYKAMIVSVREESLGREFLGGIISAEMLDRFTELGVDLSGEGGEYHTVVVDGPLFSRPLTLEKGAVESKDGYAFLATRVPREGTCHQDTFKCNQR